MKVMKKVLVLVLALIMSFGVAAIAAFAEQSTDTVWHGDSVQVAITKGENGYSFISVYPGKAYEMSNHMVTAGDGNEIPQTLVLTDASKDYTWTPNGKYSFGASNYEVLYCCDVETPYADGVYYKRLNLEDGDYYDAEAAAHIRAIVTNSYPYVSLEKMKEDLAANGFEGADKLTRAEVITAVQLAVWAYANGATDYVYSQTFDVTSNPQWGTVFHDYTNEMDVWWQTGKRKFTVNEEVGARINALAKYLQQNTSVYADKNQIIISEIAITDAVPVAEKDGVYKVAIRVALNNSGSSEKDELALTVAVDNTVVKSEKVVLGNEVYELSIEVEPNQTIEAVVSGSQILPAGAYLYVPQGGREVSQTLVGIASGKTEVYAAAETTLTIEREFETGDLVLNKQDANGNALTGAAFQLFANNNGDSILVDTYTVDANGVLKIEGMLPGSYTLVETVAPEGYAVADQALQFTVSEEGETVITENHYATVEEDGTVSFVNTEASDISVQKIWVELDEEADIFRPADISVALYRDGELYDTVVLSDENNWAHTWEDLLDIYVWSIEEVEVPEGYYAEVERDGDIFVLYNYALERIPEEEPPLTGDNFALWSAVIVMAVSGIACIGQLKRKVRIDD